MVSTEVKKVVPIEKSTKDQAPRGKKIQIPNSKFQNPSSKIQVAKSKCRNPSPKAIETKQRQNV
jgi:hypothetical protein